MPLTIVDLGQKVKAKYPGKYDDMPDADVGRSVKVKFPGQYDDFADAAPAQSEQPKESALSRFASSAWDQINPMNVVRSVNQIVTHPVDTAKALGQAQEQVGRKAISSFQAGDYPSAVRHAIGWAIPVLGPQIDAMGDKAQEGDLAGASGSAVGFGATAVLPEAIGKISGVRILPKVVNHNPVDAAAVGLADQMDIPISAGVRTGNTFIKGAEKLTSATPLGSVVAGKAAQRTAEGLRRGFSELADRAYPTPVVAEQAGAGMRSGIEDAIGKLKRSADEAYGDFRKFADDPANARDVQTGSRQVSSGLLDAQGNPIVSTVPITERIAVPVDMTAIKASLGPIYSEMQTWMEPAKRNASAGFQAIKSIVEGPDHLPASVAEKGLGGLKTLAREAESADLRNVSEGLAAGAVKQLQSAIDTTVAKAGPNAFVALQRGRAAHAAKMEAADVLSQLRDEPVQAFGQAIWMKDSGIDRLRDVAKLAPQEMPKVGRAYLEDLFSKATADGAWNRSQGIWQQWQNLGPETKKLLFKDPKLLQNLDDFFTLAKRIGENPNPSGSATTGWIGGQAAAALTGGIQHPMAAAVGILGPYGVAKLLHSPFGAKILKTGLTIPLGDTAARAAWLSQISRLAGMDSATADGQRLPTLRPATVPGQ